MLKELTPNPLEVFGIRKVDHLPDHFETADLNLPYNIKDAIDKWIEHHLKGRYYLGKGVYLDSSNKIENSIKVGFEDSKELSFFMLACPHLKY